MKRLAIADAELLDFTLFKRSYDARKKNSAILFICIVDVTVRDEAAVLQRLCARSSRGLAPDTAYHPVAQAPAGAEGAAAGGGLRPVRTVRRAAAGADGLQAHRAGARPRRAPAHAGHLGAVAQEHADAGIQRAVRRRRRGPVLRRQALQPDQGPEVLRPQGDARVRARRRAGGNPVSSASRISAPSGSPASWRRCAREIIALGGEVRFESKVTDLLIENGQIEGVVLANGETLHAAATWCWRWGTARATRLRMLEQRGVFLEAKPFAIGFRIEHPQSMIDKARFGRFAGHPQLGAADYKLVHHASNGRAVYSFCMCPGGTVVAATSEAAARGHQRHEPVFAQRAQRQCRHRRGHQSGAGFSRRAARRRRAAGSAGIARLRARRQRLLRARPAGRRFPARHCLRRSWAK